MPDVVEIGAQINVENPRLPLGYCLDNSLDRSLNATALVAAGLQPEEGQKLSRSQSAEASIFARY
ncbi:hypothetical protein ABIF97_004227 [Bradyrhizobium japonicum]